MFEDLIKKATGGLDGVANELLNAAQDKIKEKVAEAFLIHKLEKLKANIARVGKVKTILNPDSIIELNDIFIENAVSFNEKRRFESIDDFGSQHVLIEGGPGQGCQHRWYRTYIHSYRYVLQVNRAVTACCNAHRSA
jgi:hypothetical protein